MSRINKLLTISWAIPLLLILSCGHQETNFKAKEPREQAPKHHADLSPTQNSTSQALEPTQATMHQPEYQEEEELSNVPQAPDSPIADPSEELEAQRQSMDQTEPQFETNQALILEGSAIAIEQKLHPFDEKQLKLIEEMKEQKIAKDIRELIDEKQAEYALSGLKCRQPFEDSIYLLVATSSNKKQHERAEEAMKKNAPYFAECNSYGPQEGFALQGIFTTIFGSIIGIVNASINGDPAQILTSVGGLLDNILAGIIAYNSL